MRAIRFWEIDFLRGIAIILMIIYHFLFDLNLFEGWSIDTQNGLFLLLGRTSAALFLVLVGISLTLSWSKGEKEKRNNTRHFILRGIKLFLLGLLITIFTWLLLQKEFIIFGVLHFIGVSIILSIPFLKLSAKTNMAIGLMIIIIGLWLSKMTFPFNHLLWLGFVPQGFNTLDYFPTFPWFGIVLFGVSIGRWTYKGYFRKFKFIKKPNNLIINMLCYAGKNSLLIYFIHQPILISITYLLEII
ncbi:DUF1624 domain-containing protein [Candidatus Micrarchaeota archaeon]|nr:DUF1624 domain-containing protein [Candidatus Micrarchaeota archaeon]